MKIAKENGRRKEERQEEENAIIVKSKPEKYFVSILSGILNFSLRC